MNIRDLVYLVAVAEHGHFGRAADACFVSQPTLSGQLRKLEETLGVVLFERTSRSVTATRAGLALIAQARTILEEVERLKQMASSAGDPLAGKLSIGAIHTISPYLIPELLPVTERKLPRLELILNEGMTEHLTQMLIDHQLDVALLATPVTESELIAIPLYREPFWFAHAINDPHPPNPAQQHQLLTEGDLLLLTDGHCLADQVLDLCRDDSQEERQEQQRNIRRVASLETLLRLVGKGYGRTLLPLLAINRPCLNAWGVEVCRTLVEGAERQVSLVFRATFPRRKLIDQLTAIITELYQQRATQLEIPPEK
jgi:LysR family transcriptional regulator, hydrogen peroxide-inducible genes activator